MAEALEVKAGLALLWRDGEPVVEERVCVTVEGGVVSTVSGWSSCGPAAVGGEWALALPQPANAHVHSADFAFPEFGVGLRVEEAVAPPGGLKHRLLSTASPERLAAAIASVYRAAWEAGTGLLVDFREGGGEGCRLAVEAARGVPGMRVLVLGRPGPGWRGPCEGLGASSPLDYPRDVLASLAREARPAMAHVAETPRARMAGDLEAALEAGLDAVVHGVFLSRRDLEELASRRVGLVACVRSNMWHSLGLPPLRDALEAGVTLGLGSDNAAWMTPDPWEEARHALYVLRLQGVKEGAAAGVAWALFVGGYRLAGEEPRLIREGGEAHFLIAATPGGVAEAHDRLAAVVKRVGREHVVARVDGASLRWLR